MTFYSDALGLTGTRSDAADHVRLGWGAGQWALELHDGEVGLDHFAIEVPDPGELEELIDRMRNAGVVVEHLAAHGGHPESFVLFDPDGRRVEWHGRVDRVAEHAADPGRRPVRLQHITLATTAMRELVDFYVDVLGFRVSDRMGETFTWLRCGAEHHTVALVESDSPRKLDHFSFDLDSWVDFKVWCDRLSAMGLQVVWGPGRHGPGNNLFIMFDDPSGYHIELSSEMEQYHDDLAQYTPRVWLPAERTVNLWGGVPDWRRPQFEDD